MIGIKTLNNKLFHYKQIKWWIMKFIIKTVANKIKNHRKKNSKNLTSKI
jgi:hypothetical protein